MSPPVLSVQGLVLTTRAGRRIVDGVSLEVGKGELLGVVGETGCGKTSTALACLGFFRPGIKHAGGTIVVAGEKISAMPERRRRELRGKVISYVPQEPGVALNPSLRIGEQIRRMVALHSPTDDEDAVVVSAVERVELPGTEEFLRRYPHQLSGGQQQRVAIAVALACRPAVVVLDEPTTGLDVLVQAGLLDEIKRLQAATGVAMVYVSHDVAAVASIADQMAVMYAGRIVEQGPTNAVIGTPRHPYTRGLIRAIPDSRAPKQLVGIPGLAARGDAWEGCAFRDRCELRSEECSAEPELAVIALNHLVRCFHWDRSTSALPIAEATWQAPDRVQPLLEVTELHAAHVSRSERVVASAGVSFAIAPGECLALVGASGSGKTTIARCIAGLHVPESGVIKLGDVVVPARARDRPREIRRRIQIVFQNPYDSLNPRHTAGDAIARPARLLRGLSGSAARKDALLLLEKVRLPAAVADRYPAELSGGERQRVAIARALAAGPDLLVCDEITSALDVSVQAAVLNVIDDLRRDLGVGVLLISHDLGVVASVASEIAVLRKGEVCEMGSTREVMTCPRDEYTRQLVEAAPSLEAPAIHATGTQDERIAFDA
jgi:peptide/nickel transport system ATP-binding protein